jgi:hypothetical protein
MSAKELFSSIIKVLSRTSVINLRTAQLVSSLQSAHFIEIVTGTRQ